MGFGGDQPVSLLQDGRADGHGVHGLRLRLHADQRDHFLSRLLALHRIDPQEGHDVDARIALPQSQKGGGSEL